MKKIGILGSTGSVGVQALEIIKDYREEFELVFISGHRNIEKLIQQAKEYHPQYVCISDEKYYDELKSNILDINIHRGMD